MQAIISERNSIANENVRTSEQRKKIHLKNGPVMRKKFGSECRNVEC